MQKAKTLVLLSVLAFLGINSFSSDSTKYILEVHLYDMFNKSPLPNAQVIVSVENQKFKSAVTDRTGVVQIQLIPKTDFTITVLMKGYLSPNFKITTRNKPSSKFSQKIGLSPICAPRYFYHLEYGHNQIIPMETSSTTDFMNPNDLFNLMNDNPSLVIELLGYCSFREDSLISFKRAQYAMNFLVSQGIHPDRIIATDAGTDKYGHGNLSDIFKLDSNRYLVISRTVDIRVLRDDYDTNYAFVDSNYFNLKGEILGARTKNPIPFCTIYLLAPDSKLLSQITTDSLGGFNWFIQLDSLINNETGEHYAFTSYSKGYLKMNSVINYNLHYGSKMRYSNYMAPDSGKLKTPMVKFDYNKFEIESSSTPEHSLSDSLDYVTYRLQEHPKLVISITGNQLKKEKQKTSLNRVNSVYTYLLAQGISKEQLQTIDAGSSNNSQEIWFSIVSYEFTPPN